MIRREDRIVESEEERKPLQELLMQRMPVAGAPRADHMRDGSEYSATIAVFSQSKSKLDTPRGELWNTLLRPTAEGAGEEQEVPMPHIRVANGSPEKQEGDSPALSPFMKIPDALTSYLLASQHRNA